MSDNFYVKITSKHLPIGETIAYGVIKPDNNSEIRWLYLHGPCNFSYTSAHAMFQAVYEYIELPKINQLETTFITEKEFNDRMKEMEEAKEFMRKVDEENEIKTNQND